MTTALSTTRHAPRGRQARHAPLVLLLLVVCLGARAQPVAPDTLLDFDVQAERRGELIEVQARAVVRAPLRIVWQTLTDYDRLHEFIPGMESSRVVGRQGTRVTVEQRGQARFLFLSVPIAVTVESTERPPYVVEVRRLSGTLRHLRGRYEALPMGDGGTVRLRWIGVLSPEDDLPPLIGTALVRLLIEDQFAGMVHEIERRAGYRAPPPAAPPPAVRGNNINR